MVVVVEILPEFWRVPGSLFFHHYGERMQALLRFNDTCLKMSVRILMNKS
jgi:hypothetical protein